MNARLKILRQVLTRKWFTDQRTPLEMVSGDLTGKTVVITGSNRGVGFEAAKHFAGMNVGRLILACRSIKGGNLAAQDICASTGCGSVECWLLDLGSFASVQSFATRIEEENIRVDIFIGNAATMSSKLSTTEDEWETMLQVNYLSNVLLTILLLPHMSPRKNEFQPRIILMSSEAHYFIQHLKEADGPEMLSKLNDPQHCSVSVMEQRYFVSKLFVLFFSRELAHRVNSETSPIIVSVTPGLCSSDLDIESTNSQTMRYLKRVVMSFISRTPEMGSRTIIHAAINPEGPTQHGRYLANCRIEVESNYSLSTEGMLVQHRLWDETMHILQSIEPRVEKILQAL
ncbi:short-chain dehydrogenase [Mycena belliarum]|uniref:Short-chain dehydrogenase n=1 Tax=Mycena belliarum TaxID=1033014 RepID=A0AAD6TUV2_9AGAR|nr:short-chain dehydrogenase [Mycena belliae]